MITWAGQEASRPVAAGGRG